MSGFSPYGNNPQYPPGQNQMYPQVYPNNPPQPGQGGYPGQGYQPPAGFPPSYQPGYPAPGQPGAPPSAMSYPGMQPTAPTPQYGGYPGYTPPTQGFPAAGGIEWIPTSPDAAQSLSDRAIVAGYEGHDNSPLWVIRSRFEGDLIPGKLAVKHRAAYVPWGGRENQVHSIEVCCGRPDRVRWVEARDGQCPPGAVVAGNTATGEPLYVGRAREQGSLTPGKIQPSHNTLYISFAGREVAHKVYEVLCTI